MTTELAPPPNDEHWMRAALGLAERGRGRVEPNPMVGSVVVDADGRLVGEGWHEQFGGPHAEVHALAAAGERARGGTICVTLEPCCHHGKTPPCTDAILAAGVRRVVVAVGDPFPRVAGGGLKILRDAGLDVSVGVGSDAATRINAPYFKLTMTGRPWVIAKWAMTLDGKIATRTGDSQWISGVESRAEVHRLRGRVDAVIVGRRTLEQDDPLLTARPPGPRTAARVVISASGRLPEKCRLRASAHDSPVLVFIGAGQCDELCGWREDGVEIVSVDSGDNGLSIGAILGELGRRRMTNVLVEGGGGLIGSFLDADAVDEVWAFVAPVIAGGHGPSPVAGVGADRIADATKLFDVTVDRFGPDMFVRGRRRPGTPPEQQK